MRVTIPWSETTESESYNTLVWDNRESVTIPWSETTESESYNTLDWDNRE